MSLTSDQITAKNFDKFAQALAFYINGLGSSDSGSGHTIKDSGNEMKSRAGLNFTDFDLTDDSTNNETDVKPHELTDTEIEEILSGVVSPAVNILRLNNKFDKANMYSTNEQIVGQWIDGKPLYQKTFTYTTSSSTTTSNDFTIATITDLNVDTLTNIQGTVNQSNGSYLRSLDSVYPSIEGVAKPANSLFVGVSNISGVMQIYGRLGSLPTNAKINVTIRYTKTTDTAMGIGSDTDYSTTEKIVGTWIDGKPLYQKTVLCTTATSITDGQQAMNSTNHNISNIDYIVDTHIHYNTECVIWDTNRYYLSANASSTSISLRCNRKVLANTSFYVTIQYTKTTD